MPATYTIKRGATRPALRYSACGDLTGATARFVMADRPGAVPVVDAPAEVAGEDLIYRWAATDTLTARAYYAEFRVTFPSGAVQVFPSDAYLAVEIMADLGGATAGPNEPGATTGSGSATEGADTAAGAGTAPVTGSGLAIEGADTATGAGSVANVAPTITTQPSITGNATTGSVLTLNEGAASGTPAPTGTIQWLRGTTAISGATGATYTLVSGDVGQDVSARVTWTNSAGSVQATSNAITGQAAPTATAIGGTAIGTMGAAGTIYEGYRLADGDDFTTFDLMTQASPDARYIPSHRRRGRRAINSGAHDYYWTPDHTGYADAGRGVAIGSGSADLLVHDGSKVSLSTRLANAQEKALGWSTSASLGPERPQAASAFHSAGSQAVKWPCIIEARMRIPTGAQMPAGTWPAFWTENVLPTWANTGEWDFEWDDSGKLYNNFITGTSANDSIAHDVVDTSDGQWHTFSIVATAESLTFHKDGALLATATKRPDAHVTGPMFWWFRIGVDLNPPQFRMTYAPSAWGSNISTMEVDYVRIWTRADATNLGYQGVIATENVAFTGSINRTLPSKTELWGREDVTEYLIWQPIESAEPGISQVPLTGAPNTWYGRSSLQNGQWGPTFVTWNAVSRSLSASGFDQSGRMIGHLVAWDDAKGGTAGFARIVVNVGPRLKATHIGAVEGPVNIDVYAMCDAGMLTSNASGQKAKTIAVTGLPSGLTYDDATGMLTGTAAAGSYPLTIACTNSIGQTGGGALTLSVSAVTQAGTSYESWTGPGWFDMSDAATLTVSGTKITRVANKRSGGDALNAYGAGINAVANGIGGRQVARFTRFTADPARLSAGEGAISAMCRGEDKPYTVITVYNPTDANTGFIWGWSDTVNGADAQQINLIRRTTNASIRRQLAGTTTNDVTWGSGHGANTPRIVAVQHTGTAVTVWDNSLTPVVSDAPQNTTAFNNELAFYIGAAEAQSSTDPTFNPIACAMDMGEIVIEDRAVPAADIQQAISDMAAKWGITLT